MSETPTPRTDAAPPAYDGCPSTVYRTFARQLERDLAAAQARIAAMGAVLLAADTLAAEVGCEINEIRDKCPRAAYAFIADALRMFAEARRALDAVKEDRNEEERKPGWQYAPTLGSV